MRGVESQCLAKNRNDGSPAANVREELTRCDALSHNVTTAALASISDELLLFKPIANSRCAALPLLYIIPVELPDNFSAP